MNDRERGEGETYRFTELFAMNLIIVVLPKVSSERTMEPLWGQQMCVCMCIDLHKYNVFIRFSLYCLIGKHICKLVGHFISSVAMEMCVRVRVSALDRLFAELCISLEHIEQIHLNLHYFGLYSFSQ